MQCQDDGCDCNDHGKKKLQVLQDKLQQSIGKQAFAQFDRECRMGLHVHRHMCNPQGLSLIGPVHCSSLQPQGAGGPFYRFEEK